MNFQYDDDIIKLKLVYLERAWWVEKGMIINIYMYEMQLLLLLEEPN